MDFDVESSTSAEVRVPHFVCSELRGVLRAPLLESGDTFRLVDQVGHLSRRHEVDDTVEPEPSYEGDRAGVSDLPLLSSVAAPRARI